MKIALDQIVSIKIFAGIAMLPSSFDSTCNSTITDVWRSEAVIKRLPPSISNKTFSKIGTTGFEVITPLIELRFFSKYDEETIKFIIKKICESKFINNY